MAVYQANASGNAPPNLNPGDYVNTNGGMYMVANPGDYGAKYNPASGYWSIKSDGSSHSGNAPSTLQSALTSAQTAARENTEQSQAFAREQMVFQKEQNAKSMAFSSEEAAKNRSWQERMSNTAHQREIKDLISAGLNPILSAMGGSGAAVTSGATASGVTSSGASGKVDESYSALVGHLASTLLNNQTSLDIAKLQAGVQEYVAQTHLQATLGAAGTSAMAILGSADRSAAASRYVSDQTHDRPNTTAGVARKGIESLGSVLDSLFSGIGNAAKGLNWEASASGRNLTAGKR